MSSIYELHKIAQEGVVFYKPELMTEEEYVKEFFPPRIKEANYKARPKLGLPITTSIINRIVNTTLSDLTLTSTSPATQAILDKLTFEYGLKESIHQYTTNAFTTGTCGVVLVKAENEDFIIPEGWDGRFINVISSEALEVMYDLETEKGEGVEICPVFSESQVTKPKQDHVIITKFYDNYIADGVLHNLPFSPFTIFRSLDRSHEDIRYGAPYHMRYKNAQIEYQKVFSGMLFDIQVMKNVWKTNKTNNPNQPLSISTDQIIYLGADGTLEQAIRELNFAPETLVLQNLKQTISDASSVPSMLFGMEDASKFPSGVTLAQLYLPFVDLIKRTRPLVQKAIEDLVYKLLYANTQDETLSNNFEVLLSSTINPSERTERVNEAVLLLEKGIITSAEAKEMLGQWLK